MVAMKEPDFNMNMMTTYGIGQRVGDNRTRKYIVNGNKQQKVFKYPKVIANHFSYRQVIDNHNAQQQNLFWLRRLGG